MGNYKALVHFAYISLAERALWEISRHFYSFCIYSSSCELYGNLVGNCTLCVYKHRETSPMENPKTFVHFSYDANSMGIGNQLA